MEKKYRKRTSYWCAFFALAYFNKYFTKHLHYSDIVVYLRCRFDNSFVVNEEVKLIFTLINLSGEQ